MSPQFSFRVTNVTTDLSQAWVRWLCAFEGVDAMRARDIMKTIGHIVLSVVLTVLIYAVTFGLLVTFADDSISGPPSLANMALSSVASFIVIGALIAQWHRRVSIGRRLLSFIVFCALSMLSALSVLLPPMYMFWGVSAAGMVAIVASLVTLGTIDFPWPIPIARLWRGEIGLAPTFWLWISCIGAIVIFIFTAIAQLFYEFTGSFFVVALKVALSLIFMIFAVVSLWRSARNYKGPRRWRMLARSVCVIYGISVVVNLTGMLGEVPFFKAAAVGDQSYFNSIFETKSR
jgi:hypothetical protein